MKYPVPGDRKVDQDLVLLLSDSPELFPLLDVVVERLAGLSQFDSGHRHGELEVRFSA